MTQDELQADLTHHEALIIAKAVNGCPKCFGRGHNGWNETARRLVTCKCVKKALRQILQERIKNGGDSGSAG